MYIVSKISALICFTFKYVEVRNLFNYLPVYAICNISFLEICKKRLVSVSCRKIFLFFCFSFLITQCISSLCFTTECRRPICVNTKSVAKGFDLFLLKKLIFVYSNRQTKHLQIMQVLHMQAYADIDILIISIANILFPIQVCHTR